MKVTAVVMLLAGLIFGSAASAEIVSSSPTHFKLRHETVSNLAPDELWQRLVNPASWWHPDHTYSGDSGNLTLSAEAGGLWREDWQGGSVLHGQVLFVEPGKRLRLLAPFGPLQELGAYTIWTITIEASDKGTVITFDEVASGPPGSDLATVANAVDYVKQEAVARLVGESP